jgi:hypothetical protein
VIQQGRETRRGDGYLVLRVVRRALRRFADGDDESGERDETELYDPQRVEAPGQRPAPHCGPGDNM